MVLADSHSPVPASTGNDPLPDRLGGVPRAHIRVIRAAHWHLALAGGVARVPFAYRLCFCGRVFHPQAELEMKMDKALRETRPEKWGKVQGYVKKAAVTSEIID